MTWEEAKQLKEGDPVELKDNAFKDKYNPESTQTMYERFDLQFSHIVNKKNKVIRVKVVGERRGFSWYVWRFKSPDKAITEISKKYNI